MAKTIAQLRTEAQTIRDASAVGENTATRVGGTIEDVVDYLEETNGIDQDGNALRHNTFLNSITRGKYLDANGAEISNAQYSIYTYLCQKGMTLIHVAAHIGASAYLITYNNNGIVSKYIGNSTDGINFDRDIFLHEGVTMVRISARDTDGLTVTDNYGGYYENYYPFSGEIISLLGNLIPLRYGYINSSGTWGVNYRHYCIPISNVQTIRVTSNSSGATMICFFSTYTAQANAAPIVTMSAGWHIYYEVPAGKTETIPIPNDAKYLYIAGYDSRRPVSVCLLSERLAEKKVGTKISVLGEQKGKYYDTSLNVQSNASASIVSFDVSSVDCIYVRGRLAAVGKSVFRDSSDNIIGTFEKQTPNTGINTDTVYNVPTGAVKAELSIARDYPLLVSDVSWDKGNADNMFSGKTVAFIGDSITAGVGTSDNKYRYSTIFSGLARCNEINLGVNGTCFAANTKNGKTADRFITRATAANIGNADVIFVFGGTNDFTYDIKPIGDLFAYETISSTSYRGTQRKIAPTDNEAFGGAVHELILQIRSVNPNARLIFITSLNRGVWVKQITPPASNESNANGDFQQDFNDALKVICNFYAIPVVDMTALFDQNFMFDNATTQPPVLSTLDDDGIHPNDNGHKRIAECLYQYCIHNIKI